MYRALLPGMAFALGAGCAVGAVIPAPGWWLPAAFMAAAFAAWRRSSLLIWVAFFFAGIALGGRTPPSGAPSAQFHLLRELRGTVASMPEEHGKSYGLVLAATNLGTKFLVYVPKGMSGVTIPQPGDYVHVWGEFESPEGGWAEYLRLRGVAGVFWAEGVEVLEEGKLTPLRVLYGLRETLRGAIRRAFPGEARPLVEALLLGARGGLDRDLREEFRRAGAAHLLALSGLHLGIIAYGLWRLLGLFRIRPGHRYLLLFSVVGLYVGLVGGRISLVRAGIMFGFLGFFWVLWEWGLVLRDWYDPLQGLSAAAMVVLSIWPWSALDLGFQLSFSATAGIILGWPIWRDSWWHARLPRFFRPAGNLLWVSLCAQGATVGFVGSAFGYISPYGIVANLLLIPWTGLIIWVGLLLLALSPLGIAPVLGEIAGKYLVAPYLGAVEWLAELPGAQLPVGRYFGLWYAFAALVVIALRSCREGRRFV